MPIRNVIFDFGGVLIRWKPQEIIDDFYRDAGLRSRLGPAVFQHPDWLEMDRGTLDEETAVQRFAARMERPPEEMRALMEAVRAFITPMEPSFALARQLEQRGIALYGLSNIAAHNFAYLRDRYDHWQVFRGIVISGEVKLIKPDPAIFMHILQQYQLDPKETAFIDDLAPNIEAARQLGFRAIQFHDVRQCERDLEVVIGTGS